MVATIILHFEPAYMMMPGIAAGIENDIPIGDLVAASEEIVNQQVRAHARKALGRVFKQKADKKEKQWENKKMKRHERPEEPWKK